MSATVEDFLRRALELDSGARAELATLLLESLPADPQQEVEASWATTIERRVEERESGAVRTIPWEELRAEFVRGAGDV